MYVCMYVCIYMVFIMSQGFSIPYRKLVRKGFEPTSLRLSFTYSNHRAIWPNGLLCVMVKRIK